MGCTAVRNVAMHVSDVQSICLLLLHLQAAMQHAAEWVANTNAQALLVGGVSLLCSAFTPAAVSRFVPGSLLGLVAGTLTALYTKSSAHCTCVEMLQSVASMDAALRYVVTLHPDGMQICRFLVPSRRVCRSHACRPSLSSSCQQCLHPRVRTGGNLRDPRHHPMHIRMHHCTAI